MAEIIVHVTQFRDGRVYRAYKWVGSPRETAFLSYRTLRGMRYSTPPWACKVVEWQAGGAIVARTDGLNRLSCAWHAFRAKMRWTFGLAYYRLWLTLEVWNLAEVGDNALPTWRNLKRFRRRITT
ncbi:MAG: hypothetical protein ACYC5Y_05185 [Symbiobacteriia bacterium]